MYDHDHVYIHFLDNQTKVDYVDLIKPNPVENWWQSKKEEISSCIEEGERDQIVVIK